jgi:hypothetical protein
MRMPKRKQPIEMTWNWHTWPWQWCKACHDSWDEVRCDDEPDCSHCGKKVFIAAWDRAEGGRGGYRMIGDDALLFCWRCVPGPDEGERAT